MGNALEYFDTLIMVRTSRLENERNQRIEAEKALAAAISAGEKDQKIIDLLNKQVTEALDREEQAKKDLKEAEKDRDKHKFRSKVKNWLIVGEAVVIGYFVLKH